MKRAIALAFALLVAGCNSSGTSFSPQFSETEETTIEAGFVEWPSTAPEWISVVRVTDADVDKHPECTGPADELAVTSRSRGVICLFVDRIVRDESNTGLSYDAELQAVAAHEYGHALGLKHTSQDARSIMRPALQPDVTTVQPEDLRALQGAS